MTEWKIEKGIPFPTGYNTRWRRYPWPEMEVGDSVLVPGEGRTHTTRVSNAAKGYGKKHGMQFITRTVDGGARVWRTA
jgi:hypothetical protein